MAEYNVQQKQFIQGLLNKYAKPCKGIDTG